MYESIIRVIREIRDNPRFRLKKSESSVIQTSVFIKVRFGYTKPIIRVIRVIRDNPRFRLKNP